MIDRTLKPLFVAFFGLMALLYVIHNIINLGAAYGAVGYVLSLENNAIFTNNLLPAIGADAVPIFAWIIFLFEIASGLLCLWGAWKLWSARGGDTATYESAKGMAKLGLGLGVVTWFGLFGTLGGAGYQMWQHEIGAGSLGDAFKFSVWALLGLLYLGQRESTA
ncbi:DUF2165 domain-containing protein [Qipengyuania aquimaris]|uniref:DUF2165 domain-containing protein n=1 Tax=Qipengyuania aquimaris TaxID=255984 RepID=UPI001FD5F053|nr:DUF2165 domain-containing protein [Qipengyuania aquimaris]UOR14688.1 DUF2165 domain-containing protein [Qipengyuania aquimaris]